VHCSYLRGVLDELGPAPFPEDRRAGEDTVVNEALFAMGYGAYYTPDLTFVHHTPCRTTPMLVRHLFVRGRSRGRILLEEQVPVDGALSRPFVMQHFVRHVPDRVWATTKDVAAWGGPLRARYALALPMVTVAAVAYWMGIWYELVHCRFRLHGSAGARPRCRAGPGGPTPDRRPR
jgi:hypothetical protein